MNRSFRLCLTLLGFAQVAILPYTVTYAGLESFPAMCMVIVSSPFVITLMRRQELLLVIGVLSCAGLATLLGAIRFPEAGTEYAKCLLSFSVAVYGAYIAYVTLTNLSSGTCVRIFAIVGAFYCLFSLFEVTVPSVRNVSISISERLGGLNANLANHELRDELLHGGFRRPLCGTSEPSRVAIPLGVCIGGLLLLLPTNRNSLLLIAGISFVALAVTRSPSLATMLVGVTASKILADRGQALSKLLMWLPVLVIGAFVAGNLLSDRLSNIGRSEDGSFKERVVLPICFTYVSLRDTYGLGVGFVGAMAEPGNSSLKGFFPMVVEAVELADVSKILSWYSQRGYKIHVSTNAFCSHWFFNGIPIGLVSAFFAYRFVQSAAPGSAGGVFFLFLLIGTAIGGYDTMKFTQPLMMLVACHAIRQQEVSEEEDEFADEDPSDSDLAINN
jgi:hypothetical protein